ncbi:hypothetical protein ACHAXR_005959, partial [Thalassiosira sp. AJA248-18]
NGKGCNNYVLIIQDKEAFPEDPDVELAGDAHYYLEQEDGWFKEGNNEDGTSNSSLGKSGWRFVPDVFLSGSVHGNERVGPSSLLEMSELLVEAAYCESLPRMRFKPMELLATTTTNNNATVSKDEEEAIQRWEQELTSAVTCRQNLAANKGISSPNRQWLARLVSTRRTVVIPTANALGYSRDQREEAGIDPNRDFPFDITPENAAKCMQTTAGRSINELFRSHLFPIGLTFHGGMEVIGYEWGAPTYLHKDAPDAIAQHTIAGAYSRYANGFSGHAPYDFGTMNDKVYYVRGGMEDWAFAGSWDPDRVVECKPATFGGYPAEKTRYNNSTLRAFNMLIETSDPKSPRQSELGKRSQPLVSSNGAENGHIARNIRLALLALDVVEPYVSIRGVEGLMLMDDVVPAVNMRRYNGMSYFENSMMVWLPAAGGGVKISWTVGGAFNIDTTELIYGPWDILPDNLADVDDGTYPSTETRDSINSIEFITARPSNIDKRGSLEGRSRWHADGPHPTASDGFNPTFEAEIDVSNYPPGTTLAVFAKAKVDKEWLEPADNVGPSGLGPISHIVNARRNPSYYATNAGKVIRGRVDDWWYSAPITLVIGATEEESQVLQEAALNNAPSIVSDDGNHAKAVHINARLGFLPGVMETVHHPSHRGVAPTTLSMPWLLGTLCIAIIVVLGLVAFVRRQRRHARNRLERISEEEDAFTTGSYCDDPVDDDLDPAVEDEEML